MKKLLLVLLLSLCFIAEGSSNEDTYLICNLDEVFFYENSETIKFPIEGSLTILPKSKEFTYESDSIYGPFSGSYEIKGNKIIFSQILAMKDFDGNTFKAKYDFSLDKITSGFKYSVSIDSSLNENYIKSSMHSGKCKKTEKLF